MWRYLAGAVTSDGLQPVLTAFREVPVLPTDDGKLCVARICSSSFVSRVFVLLNLCVARICSSAYVRRMYFFVCICASRVFVGLHLCVACLYT